VVKQQRLLTKKPHIVVGTPGRIWDLMSNVRRFLAQIGIFCICSQIILFCVCVCVLLLLLFVIE
jgi:hypothetical protein